MPLPFIRRKLFIILLANDKHGKSTILDELAGLGNIYQKGYSRRIGKIDLYCDRLKLDSYIFRRSYQESLIDKYACDLESVFAKEIGADWYNKDIIILPYHCSSPRKRGKCNGGFNSRNFAEDLMKFIRGYGFDLILAYIILSKDELHKKKHCREILSLDWHKRWELYNPKVNAQKNKNKIINQCKRIGIELLQRICDEIKR